MKHSIFKGTGFKRTALSLAISICFISETAFAQNADGSLFGHAKTKEAVTVVSIENGSSRTIEADKDGNFVFSKLPPGRYTVTAGGKSKTASVSIGSGTELKFDDVATVTVTGSRSQRSIDVSTSESNTVFSAAQIQALPVGRNATTVSLLAPGTVAGDSAFGNGITASFSGASVAENGYYINGFDVTNMRNFTTFASLPFDAIGQEQIKTGGYGAEFGRSLGGVVSLSTKRGSNTWKTGASVYWNPDWANTSGKSILNQDPLVYLKDPAKVKPDRQTYLAFNPKENASNALSYNVYAGGPIIKDKLFVFGLIEGRRNSTDTFSRDTSEQSKQETPRGIIKLDWQISDNHRLELTAISNSNRRTSITYDNDTFDDKYALQHIGTPRTTSTDTGGDVEILKYTGYITDQLTLSAQFGRLFNLTGKLNDPTNFGAECPSIVINGSPAYGCWNPSQFSIRDAKAPDDSDTRIGKRVDLEYLVGAHTIRAGWDAQDFTSTQAGSTYSGGVYYRYYNMPANRSINGVIGAGTQGNTEYVRARRFDFTSGSYLVKNDAFYLEDSWKILPRVMVYGGVRSESFNNKNSDGISFVDRKNMLAPRFGAAWDVNGDASLKVFGNAGRYYIPVASQTNINSSTASYDEQRFYNFTGKDPKTLAPLGLGPEIGRTIVSGSRVLPNPGTVTDTKLRPMSQDEYILGFERAISKDLTVGVKAVYRAVNDGMDDFCGGTAIYNWAQKNGYPNWNPNNGAKCILVNPGRDVNLKINAEGDGKLVDVVIPNSALGLAKYSRMYKALEFSVERPFDGKWGLSGNYVYSIGKGTAEGYVQSDLGQESAGTSQDFDFGALTDGAYGTLPNNRVHNFKLYGTYAITENFHLGGNLAIASGRHTSCLGFLPVTSSDYPNAPGATQGGAAVWVASSYYCLNDQGTTVLGHRGNGPTMPWTKSLDLSATYFWKLEGGRVITFKASLFNVFNTRTVTMVNQIRDYSRTTSLAATGNKLSPNYGIPSSYMPGRSALFSARVDF